MSFILGKTIAEVFRERVERSGSQVGFVTGGERLTFRRFQELSRMVSFGLMSLGVRPGDKVAILSRTRVEWPMVDMAILGARAVSVPLYPSSAPQELVRLVNHSEARVVFVEDGPQLEKILEARATQPGCLPGLEKIVVFDPGAMKIAVNPRRNVQDVITLQALRELGRREEGKRPMRFDENLLAARPEDVFTICYTTGTTGEPKGVPLTHSNLMSVISDCVQRMSRRIRSDREVLLAFLPFSHVLGRLEGMIFYSIGGTLAFSRDPERLAQDLAEVRPTLVFAVPRVFEKAYIQVHSAVESENVVKKKVFDWAMGVGRRYHDALWARKNPRVRVVAQYALARRLVFRHITERFGGRLRYAICGGAPLSRELGEFFEIAGIRILEGYGLTETCAPVTLNDPDRPRFGTVGKPLADVTLRIGEDGEILVQSKKVFQGYYKDPEATAQALRGGWLHTGDIGRIDADGYLLITDRKKDIVITSSGRNIAPQKIENLAKTTQPVIREIVVCGDGKSYVTALITLDRETVVAYANSNQILYSEYGELIKNPKILSWVEKMLDEVNHALAGHERIRKFMILPHDFTIEGGELTASLKVKRKVIYERYRREIEDLYA